MNPTKQFHPYQPERSIPHYEVRSGGLNRSLERVRDYARRKPGAVLGGLVAVAIGLGLIGRRG